MQSFFRSIHLKIIFWALLPSLCVFVGIALLTSVTLENTALEVAKDRDVALANFVANRLSENLQKYPLFLNTLAERPEFKGKYFTSMDKAVVRNTNWLHVFDGGIVFFNETAQPIWSYPATTFFDEEKFPDLVAFEKLQSNLRPTFSNILRSKDKRHDFIVISVPVIGTDNSYVGVLAGICSLNQSTIGTTYSKVLEYESGRSNYAYLIDGTANVLYHRRSSLIGSKMSNNEAVENVTLGQAGARTTHNSTGEMVISGYAPVPGTGWGIVTQSDWNTTKNLIQFYTRLFLVIIWTGGLVSAVVVFYFIQRLLGPVKALTKGSMQIADGNFIEIPVKNTNDEIEVLTKQFNSMAKAMKASFAAREKKIYDLDQARMALSRSEERINRIINAVKDIMLMVDKSGHILWINDKGKYIFGFDVEGKKYYEVLYSKQNIPDDCFIQRYFTHNTESDTELQILVDGGYQHYWCSANAVHWDGLGDVSRVVIVCRNLTEKKQLREEVLRNAQLAALGELAAGIAHEINNPINGIINYAQIVEDHWPKENNPHAQLPKKIIFEGERIAIIISKLLTFARVDSAKKQAVALAEVIHDTLDLTNTVLKKEFISVELHFAPHLPHCKAVVHQLLQIFLNIISNARYALNAKYHGNDPDKKLEITCNEVIADDVRMVRVIFKDYGTGIAENVLDKVCNPFFSTKPPGEGTGLGLSISFGIIEEHGGVLEVRSSFGNWTEVRIDLPVWQ